MKISQINKKFIKKDFEDNELIKGKTQVWYLDVVS